MENENLKEVTIFTDGACSGNPGPGGWGAILVYMGVEKELSGYMKDTTNNRMELFAALSGLRQLKCACIVSLYSDSAYLVDAYAKDWISGWQRDHWQTKGKTEVKNQDLWKALLVETAKHRVTFIKVKGHSDNAYNNRCDQLAREQILSCQKG